MKAILMLKETPENCEQCPLYDYRSKICYGTDNDIFTSSFDRQEEERCPDCPLIEINDNIARLIEVAR